jgi:acyl carrier protein
MAQFESMNQAMNQAMNHAVMAFLAERHAALGVLGPLGSQSRVFDEGLVDSLSLFELVGQVELATGQAVDMLRFDPSEVETAEQLCEALSASLLA